MHLVQHTRHTVDATIIVWLGVLKANPHMNSHGTGATRKSVLQTHTNKGEGCQMQYGYLDRTVLGGKSGGKNDLKCLYR